MFIPVHRHHPGHDRGRLGGRGGGGQGERLDDLRVQQLAALPDARPAAQRHARPRARRSAGLVHGRHGRQRLAPSTRCSPTTCGRPTSSRTSRTTTTCAWAGWPPSARTVLAIGTAFIASQYTNLMDYIQTLFGFFNAPLFATFILGLLWERMTPAAGWTGHGGRPDRGRRRRGSCRPTSSARPAWACCPSPVRAPASWRPARPSRPASSSAPWSPSSASPKPESELRGLVWKLTPKEDIATVDEPGARWYQKPVPLAGVSLAMVIVLNLLFW